MHVKATTKEILDTIGVIDINKEIRDKMEGELATLLSNSAKSAWLGLNQGQDDPGKIILDLIAEVPELKKYVDEAEAQGKWNEIASVLQKLNAAQAELEESDKAQYFGFTKPEMKLITED